MSFKRILVALDGSPIAAHAAEVAFDLARALGADVALVCAVDSSLAYAPETGVAPAEALRVEEATARRSLALARERASGLLHQPLEFVPVGKPAAEVLKVAHEWRSDLVVIGSHGRGGVRRVLLGSVAEGVMRHAPCPVLVVRATD